MDPNALIAANIAETLKTAIEEGRVTFHEDAAVDTARGTLTVTVTIHPTKPRVAVWQGNQWTERDAWTD